MGDAARDEGVAGAQTGSEGQVIIFFDWTKHVSSKNRGWTPDGKVQVNHLLLCLKPVQLLLPLSQLCCLPQYFLLLLAKLCLLFQLFAHLVNIMLTISDQ